MSNDRFTKKVKTYQIVSAFVGFGLAVVSTIFTMKLLISFGNSGFEKVLYGAFGALIQTAQTCAYVFACYAAWIQGDRSKATMGFCLFGLLCALSLCGSIGAFVVSNQRANAEIGTSTDIKGQYHDEIAAIDTQLESLNAQSKAFADQKVATKGAIPLQNKASELMKQRSELAEKMRAVVAPKDDPDALYRAIAEFFNTDIHSAKIALYILYSIALELASVILLSFSMFMFGKQEAGEVRTIESSRPALPPETRQPDRRPPEPEKPAYYPDPAMATSPAFAEPQQYKDFRLWEREEPKAENRHAGFVPVQLSKPVQVEESKLVQVPEDKAGDRKSESEPEKVVQVSKPVQVAKSELVQVSAGQSKDNDRHKQNRLVQVEPNVVMKYIREAFKSKRKPGYFECRRLLAEKTGIDQRRADAVHEFLKNRGLIRVVDNRTFPNFDEPETMKQLQAA